MLNKLTLKNAGSYLLLAGFLSLSYTKVNAKNIDELTQLIFRVNKHGEMELLQKNSEYFWARFPKITEGRQISKEILLKMIKNHIKNMPFETARKIEIDLKYMYPASVVSGVLNSVSIDNPEVFNSIVTLRSGNLRPRDFFDNTKINILMTYINNKHINNAMSPWGNLQIDKNKLNAYFRKAYKYQSSDTNIILLKQYQKYNFFNPILPAKIHWNLAKILSQLCTDNDCLQFTTEDIRQSIKIYKEALQTKGKEKLFLKSKLGIVIDADELNRDNTKRFGTQKLLRGLEKNMKGLINTMKLNPKEKKRVALDSIATRPDLSLVFFDTHGSENGEIYLSQEFVDPNTGNIKAGGSAVKITPKELAASIIERYDRYGAESISSLRLIFNNCFSSSGARQLTEILIRHKVTPPIIISSSMEKQFSWSSLNNPYGSLFNEWIVKYGKNDIKTLVKKYLKNPEFSLSVPTVTMGYKNTNKNNKIITVPIF